MAAYDPKLIALSTSMRALSSLQQGIKGDNIEKAPQLTEKFNAIAVSLEQLHSAGKSMSNSSLIELPVDMLEFLEGEVSNPELYRAKTTEDHEKMCDQLQNRLVYLQGIEKETYEKLSAMPGGASAIAEKASSEVKIKAEPK